MLSFLWGGNILVYIVNVIVVMFLFNKLYIICCFYLFVYYLLLLFIYFINIIFNYNIYLFIYLLRNKESTD